mgnify:CR=1 FL=1
MKSSYKRLGDYILKVDERNKDYNTNLQGLSMTKEYRSSTSNIVGTDLSSYKVMRKNRFVCDFMSVIRVYKLPVVLHKSDDIAIVSPAYTTFEVNDISTLLPEYLMLWFRRSEFDRYAFFKCDSAIRGGFDWEALCDCLLPIPEIDEQRRIVGAYNTIEHRIELKRKINENLELQMQYLFNNDLASFLAKNNLPANYNIISLSEMAEYINGLAMQNYAPNRKAESLPVLKIRELRQGYCDLNSDKCTEKLPAHITIHNGDIIFSWSGSLLVDIWTGGNAGLNQHLFNVVSNKYPKWLTYLWTKFYLANFIRIADGKKTSMGHIKREDLEAAKVVVPQELLLEQLNKKYEIIFAEIVNNKIELNTLRQICNLLLSTLSR